MYKKIAEKLYIFFWQCCKMQMKNGNIELDMGYNVAGISMIKQLKVDCREGVRFYG